MNMYNYKLLKFNYLCIYSRHFSRYSRIRSKSLTNKKLTDDEINAKIRELQMLKLKNQQPTQSPGFLQIIKDGFAHGIGWSIAGRLMDKILGPRSVDVFSSQMDNPPDDTHASLGDSENFIDNSSSNDVDEGWSWGVDDLFEDD